MVAGRTFVPVIIGAQQVVPFRRRIGGDRQHVKYDHRQEDVPEDRVGGGDGVGEGRRDNLGQGPHVGDVVADVKPGQRLGEQKREQKHDHPAACRIVADLAVGLAHKRIPHMLQDRSRRGEKAENRAVSLPNKPHSSRNSRSASSASPILPCETIQFIRHVA